ncbi:MAG: DUF885 domain-containing protein [Glaciecola sp.]|nr:DUF885 domain-containing protein [Glaciecola sp.]MDG1922213.1 DUF885 domain-containing protein [Glaciecola sp.]
MRQRLSHFIRLLCIASFCILVTGCINTTENSSSPSTPKSASTTTSDNFSTLLDSIWTYEQSGSSDEENASKIPNIAPAKLAADAAQYQTYIDTLQAFDVNSLSHEEQITHTIQLYRLQNYVDEYRYNAHFVPLTSEYGFHSSLLNLYYRFDFDNNDSITGYINTLQDIPAYFDQQISYMRQGMAVGQVQPQAVMQGFESSVAAVITDNVIDSPFYQPFIQLDRDDAALSELKIQAMQVIHNDVNQAYQRFYNFLVNEYIPQAKTDIAVKTWPNGADFYQNRIKHYTTTDLSADEIHAIGLSEVARIRSEMQGILDKVGFTGSINEFIQFLRTDEQFYAKTPDALLKHAMYLSKRIDGMLPQLFNKLPRVPYGVAPVPASIAPKYTTGRYVSPRNDTQPGYYWVNTYALDKRPLYALPALTLHEAVPGHHLQISLAAEMDNLPNVRRSTYISAFGEGWGLYSEFLGKEIGFYETPYDDFGRLSYEMWRACRLVVDTGMHVLGWSRQQALDYMLENTALSEHNVTTEIDRYISWPGQALSYKLGEIKIKALRTKAEVALGAKFDLREFHAAILTHGSVPLTVLEQNIELYIQQVKGQ